MNINAPALRYHGGKWRDAAWIMSHFPPHVCYVEPFAGGASVLLQKVPSTHEVYNDADGNVVNFFRVLREMPDALVQAIELTPYSREEYTLAHVHTDDALERARRLYVRCWQSFAPILGQTWASGWRYQMTDNNGASAVSSWNRTHHLFAIAKRLKTVQVEHDDALAVIQRYDTAGTLFYVDPPYVHESRSKWAGKAYAHEMTSDEHRQLATLLHKVNGMVVLSGYASPLYEELYPGWQCKTQTTKDIHSKQRTECLWLSPTLVAQMARPHMQSLFSLGGTD